MDDDAVPDEGDLFDRENDAARLSEIEGVLAAVEAELAELDAPSGDSVAQRLDV